MQSGATIKGRSSTTARFFICERVSTGCVRNSAIFAWLRSNAIGFDVTIRHETGDIAALAVQGPTSFSTLDTMGIEGLDKLKPFDLIQTDFQGAELMVSRTGYTGDLGYELWIDPNKAEAMWDALFEAGEQFGIRAHWYQGTRYGAYRGRIPGASC